MASLYDMEPVTSEYDPDYNPLDKSRPIPENRKVKGRGGARVAPPPIASFLDPINLDDEPFSVADLGEPNKSTSDKQSLCVEILIKGNVNSFVDFFYLTHRSDDDAFNRPPIADEQLQYIQCQLSVAEKAHRRGDSDLVLSAYDKLASYFQEAGDYKTSIYFYEKCLDIAESMDDLAQQGNANLNLGLTHDAMGDTSTAISFHEKHLEIASEMEDDERLQAANHQLVEAYRRFAEEHERKQDHDQAVAYYKKCLTAAADANDLRSEGLATYRLGVACSAVQDKTASIEYHQRYLEICKRIHDELGEGAACAALAHSFKEMGDIKLSIRYLEKYLDIATRTKQAVAQAEACAALGSIYSEQSDHDRSVQYFEKTFEIARAVGDRKLIDSARINLGMARGNLTMGNYMGVVNDNLESLLKWKTSRSNF
jgi:tetratricopeptide (TPR) repeat protein